VDYRPGLTAPGLERCRMRNVPTVAANDRFSSLMSTVVDGLLGKLFTTPQRTRPAALQLPEENMSALRPSCCLAAVLAKDSAVNLRSTVAF